ncbi:hypothetical protein [Aminipila terrae]|uniref:Uncharacterized protein n=1 Tax=Aminipila terrae TaxID=2697030 RepID=A0A6P1MAZ9_9FIRM|nr:hypothetical protein [Aminipila terrae]QHI71212.1 hypothetical protein Ami3637_01310 [Aminipila terrae]
MRTIMPFILLLVNIVVIGFIAYYIIKKAVKAGIYEAMKKQQELEEMTRQQEETHEQ